MTFDKQPQQFTPAYNPVLFVISSTYSNVLYFNIHVNDVETNSRIINDKAYVSPITPTSTHYNLSDIARDVVYWQIINDGSIAKQITDSYRKIQLNMSENGVIGTTMSQLGATSSSNQFIVWNGFLPRHKFTDYTYQTYVADSASNIKFLTEKPNHYLVNNLSREYLYYLKQPNFQTQTIRFEKYNCQDVVIGTFSTTHTGTSSMVRLDVSPKAISLTQSGFFTTDVCYYTVQLFNGATAISEKKYYRWTADPDCGNDVVNILWQNSLGGIDSYQFRQPVETKNVERFTITKNPFQYDSAYNYSDIQQAVYNDKSRVIHTNISSQWQMWSAPLTNEENSWLSKIVYAKRWWIELKNGRVYPVDLVESSYLVNNNRYNRGERLQSQLTFNIIDDLVQDGQIYAGTASIPLQTTTTTTSTSTSSTTSGSSTTTTTSSSSTTSTTTESLSTYTGSGYGSDTCGASTDAGLNNRTLYCYCSTITAGCTIYTDSGGTLALVGYTHIYIQGLNWLINSSTGQITGIDPVQC